MCDSQATVVLDSCISESSTRRRQGGGEGGSSGFAQTPLWPQNILYTVQLYILSALPIVSGPLASLH